MIYIQYTDGFHQIEFLSYTILKVLKDKYECKIFRNTDKIIFNENDIIIMILNWYEPVIKNCKFSIKNKIFLFNIDTYLHHENQWNLSQNLGKHFKQNVTIFEYNPINMKYFAENNKYENIISLYFPFAYNTYYKDILQSVGEQNKDLDVLFYGSPNPRRNAIIDELKKDFKVVHVHPFENYTEQCIHIKRAKVVINIYFREKNRVFDYYRMANLISNEVFAISETPDHMDFEIEKNLIDYDKYLICAEYNDIVNTVKKYLSISEEERKNLAIKSKEWFKMNSNFEENLHNIIEDKYTYIRKLEIKDYKKYLDLIYNFTNYKYTTNIESFENILNNKNIKTFLIIINDEIIGCGSIFKLEKLHNNPIGQIEDVYIDEKYRHKGYGKMIISHLKSYGVNVWKCYKITLNCLEKNIGFYENCEFEKCGIQFKAIL